MSAIDTFPSRGRFDYASPHTSDIYMADIAHALSVIPRFCGHTRFPMSVAQHSFLVGMMLPDGEMRAVGLMHDATEAYMQDIPSPLKRLLPDYQSIEANVWSAIAARFRLKCDPDAMLAVKAADRLALAIEQDQRAISPETTARIVAMHGLDAHGIGEKDIRPWPAVYAKVRFLREAKRLRDIGAMFYQRATWQPTNLPELPHRAVAAPDGREGSG